MESQIFPRTFSFDSIVSYDDESEFLKQYTQFYGKRVLMTEKMKQEIQQANTNGSTYQRCKEGFLDNAMDRLRQEMVSLMKVDLALTKQLLLLQDSIEDLLVGDALCCDISSSEESDCETDVCNTCNEMKDERTSQNVQSYGRTCEHTDDSGNSNVVYPSTKHSKHRYILHQTENSDDSGYCGFYIELEATI